MATGPSQHEQPRNHRQEGADSLHLFIRQHACFPSVTTRRYLTKRYFTKVQIASMPSRQVIFFPSASVLAW
jgi:hypothetical protein